MKNLHFFTKPMLIITMLFFLTGCEDIKKKAEHLTSKEPPLEETAKPSTENALIVIQDESASVNYDEFEKKSIQKFLKKFFYNEIQPSTDIIILRIGDQATSKSVVNYKKIEWQMSETKDDSFKTDADRMLEGNNKRQQDQSQLKGMQKQLLDILASSAETKSQSSAVLEVLPQVAEQIKNFKHSKILLLSDLCEFSELRDFEKYPPLNSKEAEEMASVDFAKLLKQYSVLQNSFSKVERIEVLIPQNTPEERTVVIPKYWDALFTKHLGYKNKIFWSKSN